MRKINYLFGVALALSLAACSQDDDLTGLAGSTTLSGSVMTEISSSSSNAASTRFDGSTGNWESGDAIGVYLTNSDNTSILNDAENVKFTLDGDGGSASGKFTNEPGITYPDDETSINFHCYYPYIESMSQSYQLDLSDQSEDYEAYELMYVSKNTTGTTVKNSGLSVTFQHQVAKATIYVTPPSTDISVTSVTISGLPNTATFAPIGGNLTNGDNGDITPECTTEEGSTDEYLTYEAIILPVTDITDLCLKFVTSEGYTYVWSPSDDCAVSQIQAGYEYKFNIGLATAPSGGSSSSTSQLTEISADTPGTYSGSYYLTDETSGDQVDIYSWATEQVSSASIIDVTASDTDLGTLLADWVSSQSSTSSSGLKTRAEDGSSDDEGYAVALRFTAGTEYSSFDAFSVPEDITTLMLICDDPNDQAEISLAGFESGLALENLYFYNVDITGDGTSTNFTTASSISSTIEAESTTFQSMAYVFNLSGNTEETIDAINFTDCIFLNCSAIVYGLGSTTTVTDGINFTDCTIGVTNSSLGNYIVNVSDATTCAVTMDDCTVHVRSTQTILRTGSNSPYNAATFTNCVVANASSYFVYFLTASATNSYYLALDESAESLSTFTTLTDGEWSDMFANDEYSGDYTLADDFVSTYGNCGDPRWYEESSDDDSTTEE